MIGLVIVLSSVCLAALAAGAVVSERRSGSRIPPVPEAAPAMRRPRGLSGTDLRESFGARLRAEREQRSITLARVADITKIKQSLFAGLERGDLTGWPEGFFRRAFVQAYAKAVGLDAERVVAEFNWVYSDRATPGPVVERRTAVRPETPRLTLEAGRALWRANVGPRGLRALADIALVALVAAVVTSVTGIGLAWTMGVTSIVGYPVWLICFGETAAAHAHRILLAKAGRATGPPPSQPTEASLRLVPTQERASSDRTGQPAADRPSNRASDQSKTVWRSKR